MGWLFRVWTLHRPDNSVFPPQAADSICVSAVGDGSLQTARPLRSWTHLPFTSAGRRSSARPTRWRVTINQKSFKSSSRQRRGKKTFFTACFCLFACFVKKNKHRTTKQKCPPPRKLLFFCSLAVYQAQMCKLLKECFLPSAALWDRLQELVATRFLLLL